MPNIQKINYIYPRIKDDRITIGVFSISSCAPEISIRGERGARRRWPRGTQDFETRASVSFIPIGPPSDFTVHYQ